MGQKSRNHRKNYFSCGVYTSGKLIIAGRHHLSDIFKPFRALLPNYGTGRHSLYFPSESWIETTINKTTVLIKHRLALS